MLGRAHLVLVVPDALRAVVGEEEEHGVLQHARGEAPQQRLEELELVEA